MDAAKKTSSGLKLNVGCGASPTPGFLNLDNSLSARLAKVPFLTEVLTRLPILGPAQRAFIAHAKTEGIAWASAGGLPVAQGAATVVYSSHMVEHLTPQEASQFFKEAFRVLEPGGWIRLAVPDLRKIARGYVDGAFDANHFVAATLLASERPHGLVGRLKLAVSGPRHHLWMYDGPSLCRRLAEQGFVDAREVAAGETQIPDPGALDLQERADESVYVEGRKPA